MTMKAYYDNKPSNIEAVGNGSYLYRWNITEESVEQEEGAKVQYSCDEVTVWSPITADKIKKAVMTETYGEDNELKLINEYNSYELGVSGDSGSDAYKGYLKERIGLLSQVDEAFDKWRGVRKSDADKLAKAKERKILEIYEYDNSRAVNICYIVYKGVKFPYWADKYERNCLKSSLNDCLRKGIKVYRLDLRDAGVSVEIDCERLIDILSDLEVYAIKCFNRTSDHVFAVKSFADEYSVDVYDKTSGYPTIPVYEVS